ncbi:uncharacterized protein LOC133523121 [Cydia pomonella]|uniref:uncharacterized protein LOC133523121 n=1 Tax=Cydia pomonella TaxID=82600 RepID=UPI002ADD804D|nr:uncharacterized protein LOC133523121 [Cydia pomonella]
METETAKTSTKRRNKDVSDTEVTSCKQKMTYIRSRRGLFKDHNPIYEDLTKKEYPVLLQSASNELTHKVPMDILKVNGILKEILGVQYVKAAGNFYVKVYFGCAKDANAFLLNKPVLQENNWKATIPYDSIECQGIIRAPVDLSEETLLEDLKASCMILGVKRFTKKQDDGQFKPLPTVLVTFMASSRPDHVIYDHIWMPVQEYIRPLLQCFRCYKFGHGSGACKSTQVCSICSAGHFYKECTTPSVFKSSNCSGPHSAVSYTCKVKAEKIAQIKNKINGKFSYATAAAIAVTPNNSTNPNSKILKTPAKTPHGRAMIADIINSDIVLNAITKTIVELMKKREVNNTSSGPLPISSQMIQMIKELLVTSFTT